MNPLLYKALLYTLTFVWVFILGWHMVRFWRERPIWRVEQSRSHRFGVAGRVLELAFETVLAIFLIFETVRSLTAPPP
jgi:hypothetical protein